jgi:MFS family permease
VATRAETRIVPIAGVVQGITLVTVPAAATVFTNPAQYGLSSAQYGGLFVPQVIAAISGALLGGRLTRRYSIKRVYLGGLAANLVAMVLLLISQPLRHDSGVYVILLLATAGVGAGFGLTVPTLNTFTAAFHPDTVDASVLRLNAIIGIGTVLAPVFVAIFVGLGFWWGLPLVTAVMLIGVVAASARLPLRVTADDHEAKAGSGGIPSRFWIFAGFAVLYGICETMNGNWAQLDMTKGLGVSVTYAALALTVFWAMVTVGRVLFASIQRWFPTARTYRLLPFVLVVTFIAIWQLPDGAPWIDIAAFGLAGFGCSALLPLTISFGQEQLAGFAASTPGGVIAFYQLGYGLAAFGAGPLQEAGVKLPAIFGFAAVVAAVMGGCAFVITRAQSAALSPAASTEGSAK